MTNLATKTYIKKIDKYASLDGVMDLERDLWWQGRQSVCERMRASEDCSRQQMYSEKKCVLLPGIQYYYMLI